MYLIAGAHGQLGRALRELLGEQATYVDRDELDIADRAEVSNALNALHPDLVINCAAYTAVDKAESEEDEAFRINALGPENLAKETARLNIPLLHVSTDYVFDGSGCRPYREDDETNPQSAYGRTKLAGEQAVMEYAKTAAIVRTAWLYAVAGNNFVRTMMRLGAERDTLGVVVDQVGTPTFAPDLAQALLDLRSSLVPGSKEIYHYTNEGVASWYDFAIAVMELASLPCHVRPIRTEEYPTPACRPAYSVLDKSKIKPLLKHEIPHWRESLQMCVRTIIDQQSEYGT